MTTNDKGRTAGNRTTPKPDHGNIISSAWDAIAYRLWVLSYRLEEARERYADRRQLLRQAGACFALAMLRQADGVATIPYPGTGAPSALESIAASLATIAENSGAVVTHLGAIDTDVDRVAFQLEEFWNMLPYEIILALERWQK